MALTYEQLEAAEARALARVGAAKTGYELRRALAVWRRYSGMLAKAEGGRA